MNLNPINSRLRVPLGGAIILAMFAALPARADYPSTVLAQNPAGYWRLNETTTPTTSPSTANFGSLSGADGFYTNSPSLHLPGPFAGSYAVGFDGSSQELLTPWQTGLNPSTFSVELWLNPAQVPYSGTVSYIAASVDTASPRSGWYLAQDNGTTFDAGSAFVVRMFYQHGTTNSVQLAAPVTKAVGSWYHIVLTYDGTTATLYEDGVAVTNHTAAFVPNDDAPTTFAIRSDLNLPWPGQMAQAAIYKSALSAARVSAHYTAATSAATYVTAVQQDTPVLWYQFPETGEPPAANIGTLGSAATGKYEVGTTPGVPGPSDPPYPGFEAANYAASVPGSGPSVLVPALNFNTNTVTITGWLLPSTSTESAYGGIVVCHGGTTDAGLIMDWQGGLGVGYTWNNDDSTYNWSPSSDSGLPNLPFNDWAYVALVVQPNQAAIYLCDSTNAADWAGVTNFPPTGHASQAFDASTLFGWDPNSPNFLAGFAGNIDEVAMFNRALGEGELYTQYGAAVGGLQPIIFGDLQGPSGSVAAGDPITLTVDAGGTPPLTFIWRRNGVATATTSSNSLVIASSVLSDGGTYDVIISNAVNSVDSSQFPVSVVVPSAPQIQQIVGYQSRTLYPTGTLSFAVSATGGGLKYQWYKNATPIASATSSAYSIAYVVATNAGSYSLSITNVAGTATSGPPAVITIPNLAAGSYEAAVVASGPEAWWRLDDPAGSTNMLDGMGRHNGTYTNASGSGSLPTLGVPGALANDTNTAVSFTSAAQAIGIAPFSPRLNSPQFTVEAWVNTPVPTGAPIVPVSSTDANGGWWWENYITNSLPYWTGFGPGGFAPDYAYSSEAPIIPSQWSYLVITYDATTVIDGTPYPWQYFWNGQGDGYVWSGSSATTSGPFIIGARGAGPTTLADSFFDGTVDEVAVYTRVLSSTEISNHFTARGIVIIPVTFTTPLLSQTVTTGKSISFSTTVEGTAPISLQWYKDGQQIANATNATYAITNTASGDAGTYSLWATNAAATNSLSANLTVISPVSYANVTNNLVLHLTFDGNTTDSSGFGNNGTASTSTPSNTPPVFVPGIIGSLALQYTTTTNGLSGTNSAVTSASYVTLGTVGSGPPTDLQFDTTTSFSVGLWLELTKGALPGDLPFIGTATNSDLNPGWVLAPGYKNGGWEWNLNDGTNNVNVGNTVPLINDGNWHNFVLTVNRTNAVANTYLDGVLAASTSIASIGDIDIGNLAPIVIGQDPTFLYPEAGSATVDDLGIWRQALTPLQVAQIESAGRTAGRSFNTVGPQNVTITYTRSGGNIVLNYSAGTLLQSTNARLPMSQWTAVPGASAPHFTVTPSGAGNYYRVQVQ
ncbi:MAG: LamG-like jellyroll fold domain-containing protein [Limisphaerales bacterium]